MDQKKKEFDMLRWSFAFLVLALVAAVFGFGGIAAGAVGAAKFLFVLFAFAWVISLVAGIIFGRRSSNL